jgi:hypothetical protein
MTGEQSTPKWRLETREDIDGGTYRAWTDEPPPALLRAAAAELEHLAIAPFGTPGQGGERIRKVVAAAFDVAHVARVLADHQLVVGPHGLTRHCTCGVDVLTIGDLVHHQAEELRKSIVGEE